MIALTHTFWRRVPGQHLARGCAGIFACLMILLLVGCASRGAPGARATSTAGNTPTASSTPPTASGALPGAPPTSTARPSPVTGPLASPPQNCAVMLPPQTKHLDSLGGNRDVQLVGGGVFWFYGMYYPGSVLHVSQSDPPGWPEMKMVVEVGPDYNQPVTLKLLNQQTGALAWWTDGGQPPGAATQTLVLDPKTDTEDVGAVPGVPDIPHGSPDPGWSEWGLFPLFFAAGCYRLEVSWAGGSWQSVFAVGS